MAGATKIRVGGNLKGKNYKDYKNCEGKEGKKNYYVNFSQAFSNLLLNSKIKKTVTIIKIHRIGIIMYLV